MECYDKIIVLPASHLRPVYAPFRHDCDSLKRVRDYELRKIEQLVQL